MREMGLPHGEWLDRRESNSLRVSGEALMGGGAQDGGF